VARLTRGRINSRFFDPGKLVPALEVFDAVSKGSVDAGWTTAGYWIGKIPAAAFFTAVPYGPDTSEYLSWIFEGGGWQLWRELYAPHNVMPIPCQITPPEASGWFRQPITRLEQFKGMKIRFFGIGGQAIQKLGASVQLLAGGDIFPALERGILDATEFANPSLDEKLGFSKIAKHYYFPGWHQQASVGEFIVNMDRWKSLDGADQDLLITVCRDVIVRDISVGEVQQPPALERIRQDGVQVHQWPKEFLLAFKRASDEAIADSAASDPQFRRVYESYAAFRAKYAEWAKISRVPISLE
jgi:TRAP-type mannitol/chloroaromatic compound transport system substrate-binding protein